MEMLQLRYFCESAKNESFSQTAKKYMVPLTAVSISIKRLEEELEVKLFDRLSNRILLNDKGRQFYYSVKAMLDELDNGIVSLTSHPEDNRVINVFAKTARETIIRQICSFNKYYPNVKFNVNVNQQEQSLEQYDMIIDEKSDEYEEFEAFDLNTYKIRVECLSSNPICNRKTISLKDLKNQPFVTTCSDFGFFSIFADACNKKGFEPNVVLVCNDYTCRDKCVLAGMGMGVTLGSTGNSLLSDVQYLEISDFNEKYIARVYYKQSSYFGNVKAFIDFMQKVY